jgi:hypothetical protein
MMRPAVRFFRSGSNMRASASVKYRCEASRARRWRSVSVGTVGSAAGAEQAASPDFSHNVGVIAGSHSLSCRFFNAQRFAVAH